MQLHQVTRVAANVLKAMDAAKMPTPETIHVTGTSIHLGYGHDRDAVHTIAADLLHAAVHTSAEVVTTTTEWKPGIHVSAGATPRRVTTWDTPAKAVA